MRGLIGFVIAIAALATACVGAANEEPLDSSTVPPVERLIVTSTPLLADVVEELVGTTARVESLIEDDEDPRSAELSSRALLLLDPERASLVVSVGDGFEGFDETLQSAMDGGLSLFELTGLEETEAEVDGEHGEHGDPHVWIDPSAMAPAVRRLADRLSEIDPVFADPTTQDRAQRYADCLLELDLDFSSRFDELAEDRRSIVVGEDLLARFAERYGLTVVGFIRQDGVASHDLVSEAELEQLLRDASKREVFFDVTTDDTEATALVEAAGGTPVRVAIVDTAEPSSPAGTYVGLLETLVAELVSHLDPDTSEAEARPPLESCE